jgi:hypothetical protein
MSYSITIVRRNRWDDIDEESNITLQEWVDMVKTDPELEFPQDSDLTELNKDYYQSKPGYCEWNAHPNHKEPFARPYFDYYHGEITTQNVDDYSLLKAISIAEILNGKVIGQDGEFYEEGDSLNILVHDPNVSSSIKTEKNRSPCWKFW